jgi:hypothetical protein
MSVYLSYLFNFNLNFCCHAENIKNAYLACYEHFRGKEKGKKNPPAEQPKIVLKQTIIHIRDDVGDQAGFAQASTIQVTKPTDNLSPHIVNPSPR